MTEASELTPVVIVLGMHRSGTSVGMSVLSELGVACGDDLIPAGRSNLAGFWEHSEIVAIQERLLARLDRVWHGSHGTFPMPEKWLDSEAAQQAEESLVKIVSREIAAHPGRVWGFKDPRTIRLWPLWERIWKRLAVAPHPIIFVRHPAAVIRSLKKHNGLEPSRAQLVWLQHNLEALRHVGDRTRLVVDFDHLVDDPEGEISRIATSLPEILDTTEAAVKAAVAKVSASLRTNKADQIEIENTIVSEVYETLHAYSQEIIVDASAPAIVANYDSAAQVFASWRTDRSNVLMDWIMRFLVSRSRS